MEKLNRENLLGLEAYDGMRSEFRSNVMAHKRDRRLALGTNATLYFEDTLTMQYQVQEMLRIERIFESAGINEELDTYNPLIPDGKNWKATFMLEFPVNYLVRNNSSQQLFMRKRTRKSFIKNGISSRFPENP